MTSKQGRPGIPYEKFAAVWEQLVREGRTSIKAAQENIGGSNSTIAGYRERYEREQASKELALIKRVKLTEAVHRAIAGVKVQEIEALENMHQQLKKRIDEYLGVMKKMEEKLACVQVELEEAKDLFDTEKLTVERKLSAAQARLEDSAQREQKLATRYEQLHEQYNKIQQEAAASKKEIEMLREQAKKKRENLPN